MPSLTTPIALVKHATFVEQVWFHVGLGAPHPRRRSGCRPSVDDSYVVGPDETVASVIADYRRRRATRPARWRRRTRMDDEVLHDLRGHRSGLRWVLTCT